MATVMIVDDVAVIRLALQTLLNHDGHKTLCAANGLEAITRLQRGDVPDLVLLDLAMPEMDGLTVLEKLRDLPQARKLPVVVMSSQTESATVNEALRRGATEYLVKGGVSWDEVRGRLNRYLDHASHEAPNSNNQMQH